MRLQGRNAAIMRGGNEKSSERGSIRREKSRRCFVLLARTAGGCTSTRYSNITPLLFTGR